MQTTSVDQYPRLFTSGPLVQRVQRIPAKAYWTDRRFEHDCLMCMDGGACRFVDDDGERVLEPPVVFLARAGQRYRYGPLRRLDEYGFLMCPRRDGVDPFAAFPRRPWPMRSVELVRDYWRQVERLCRNPSPPGVADQIDQLARAMLAASLHDHDPQRLPDPERRLLEAEEWLREHLADDIDLAAVIARFGFSEPTFRRHWRERFACSPWQYVLFLRLGEARRLLLEDETLSVKEIAARCGFGGQRHFATRFARHHGCSPTAYRRRR